MKLKKILDLTFAQIFVFCSILLIYIVFAKIFNHKLISHYPYYNYFIDSLLHGRISIDPPLKFDLSPYKGEWYMYWGVTPILFIFPFYLLGGLHVSDVLYTLVAGLINVVLFYLLVKVFAKLINIKLTKGKMLIFVASFALATPNLFLTVLTGVWHTNQLIAVLYLLCFYIFYFMFLQSPYKSSHLLLSIIFFNLAWTARYTLITNGFLFATLCVLAYKKYIDYSLKKIIVYTTLITMICIAGTAYYNFIRFDSPFETGHSYQIGSHLYPLYHHGKAFSLSNIGHSTRVFLFRFDSFVLLLYPFMVLPLLTLFRMFSKKKKELILLISMTLVVCFNLVFILTYYAANPRYFLDLIPLLFLLGIYTILRIPLRILAVITVLSFCMNIYSILQYISGSMYY